MNRKQRRASEAEGRRLQKLPWNEFEDVTLEAVSYFSGRKPYKVLKNNKYIIFIFMNHERKGKKYIKVMCRRNDSKPICNWSDLFRIKNEIFGKEVEAVTFLPPKSELTDQANLYWFFIEKI